jgi:hypothetical protein
MLAETPPVRDVPDLSRNPDLLPATPASIRRFRPTHRCDMGPSSLFSSAPPTITADWPAQHAVFQPGHALDLVVHLAPDVDANGQPKFIQVTAEVRCTQVTEFHRTRAGNQPNGKPYFLCRCLSQDEMRLTDGPAPPVFLSFKRPAGRRRSW